MLIYYNDCVCPIGQHTFCNGSVGKIYSLQQLGWRRSLATKWELP